MYNVKIIITNQNSVKNTNPFCNTFYNTWNFCNKYCNTLKFCNTYCNTLWYCNIKVLEYFAIVLQYNTIGATPV